MKKVLFVLPKGVGGAQKISIQISNLLPKEHYDIKYLIIGKRNELDMSDLIENKALIQNLTVLNVWDFLTLRLIKLIRKEKPDIIFSSIMYLNIRVILAAKFVGGVKVIIRNDNMLKTQRWDKLKLLKFTYKKADIIIAQNEEMKDELLKRLHLSNEKVVVKYNPIDKKYILSNALQPSPYKKEDTIKYIWTGNFMPSGSKGQDILIKAFNLVKEKIPNAHLFLLGLRFETSNYYKDIEEYVIQNGLTDSVHFVGFQKNPYPWIKYANCFVLPSRIEGLPNALIDAMVLNKPVVATTCVPIISRIVKDGYNGILVQPENYKDMAEAMLQGLKLNNFKMTYQPSTDTDFIKLF